MKTTVDIPDEIYRRVKAKSAMEGRPVREVAITLFRAWVEQPDAPATISKEVPSSGGSEPAPPWFASLRSYAKNARGRYDLGSVRNSIVRGRLEEEGTR